MTAYQVLCILGIPTLVLSMFRYLHTMVKKNATDNLAMKKGIQALLRSNLISDYNKWVEKGYAPIYARQNFENCWQQYHALGVNGVMDGLHMEFLSFPTEKEETEP